MVKEGEHLATIDQRAYITARDQVAGQMQRDQAALDVAKLNYDRLKNLPLKDIASQQERDELLAVYKQAEAVVAVDQAALANAELQLAYTKIVAPISGRIGLRAIDRGNIVRSSDLLGLLTITQLQPITVVFPIPQDEIPRIQKQLAAAGTTTVLAYDRSFQTLLASGTLQAIDNQVDTTTGTLRLKAVFENTDESLFPNQFVNIRLLMQTWDEAIVVPSSAVQRGPDFSYVYVVDEPDSSVDVQKVTVAFSESGKSIISSGLQAGVVVVTEGTDKLQPKGKVTLPGAKPTFGDKPNAQGGEKGSDTKAGLPRPNKDSSAAGKPADSKPAQ
jgi:multidrug efflux system membrane fusion protein